LTKFMNIGTVTTVKQMIKSLFWWFVVTGLMIYVRVKCAYQGAIIGWEMWNEEMMRQDKVDKLTGRK